ncbi:PAC2 family protein [Jiangella aurantiaca]|uniref:PAC2 family protein n=1 Tax=Jiangella aurantiaca TaxID=2530373 RepID=A0A4R5A607_9ACTN|nr:PAC2 family protein [Jiangella aurantiaca]TDD65022.1 PAC2 family protein [Jiangella aurantiaca]
MENDGARQLRNPVLIAAFEGWNDAGEAATAGIEHLERVWNAGAVAALDPDEYYDFQVNRPLVSVDDHGNRSIQWPTTRLSVVSLKEHERDIVLLRGIEPNMRWRAFCAELLSVATDLGCEQVVTLGALLADVPHTRPVPVTVSASDPDQAEALGLEQSRYEGPTGIVGVFQDAATRAGLDAVSLWAAVPHYVAQSPCPKATMVLLQRVEDLLGLSVPMGDLAEQAEAWQHGVDELAEEDSDVAEYVRRLEEARDTVDLPEASGEHIAREFERYLRRRDT